jgi:hypothetical protein
MHEMRIAVARAKLHEAKTVAIPIEPHGLGIDSDAIAERDGSEKVAVMEGDGHCNISTSVVDSPRLVL